MKVIIDTSSLLSLVRYYLPFDNQKVLYGFIKDEIINGNILIIDKIFDECKFNSKGLVLNELNFLDDINFKRTKYLINTDTMILSNPKKFYNQLDNQFIVGMSVRNMLDEGEYQMEREKFIKSADAKMIIFALTLQNEYVDISIITEETPSNNDRKIFKKIPAICKLIDVPTLTLPQYLKTCDGLKFIINKN